MKHKDFDSAKDVARILLDVLAEHGVADIVCSPGSRNAPLLIAADARLDINTPVVIDERSAAFVALGMAMVSRRPVALICTSGSALLNYAPAVAEAYYHGIPLIVISADRPLEWIDQDDSQTIRQPHTLDNIVKGSYSISDREEGDRPGWYENLVANDAMLNALADKPGPVHINVRLSPPLGQLRPFGADHVGERIIRNVIPYTTPDRAVTRELASQLTGRRVMIVAGFMEPDARLNRAVAKMAANENVAVMAETISNLHLPPEAYAVDSALCMLDENDERYLAPDVVISVGGALVSRMLKEFLRRCAARNPQLQHWAIGHSHTTVDPFQTLTCRIEADPGRMLTAIAGELTHLARTAPTAQPKTEYASVWLSRKRLGMQRMERLTREAPWCDLKAYSSILSRLPKSANLFLSNGTSIRYAQILSRSIPHAEYSNRGVSGIDGSTSTAIGGALMYAHDTFLLTGDTSFAYDLSALLTLQRLQARLKIILVSNGGGAIFRFISSTAQLECRESLFCTDPALPAEGLATAFGIPYRKADSADELHAALNWIARQDGCALLEVVTPAEVSAEILRNALARN